ncbi:acyl-CoA-binding protein (ACBP)/diazepam binding inhibitor (DBI)/endozepine (EP) [Fusarium solani]
MAAPQSDAFKKAIEDSKKLTSKPGPDELLQLYALYKVGTANTLLQGKAKYNAWKKVVDDSVTPDAAQEQYVKLVEELKEKYGYDENKVPEAVGGN